MLRHPDHISKNATLYYAHHEKMVCVDQDICFMGGFDLCFGRWDDHHHRITDFGSAMPAYLQTTDGKRGKAAAENGEKLFIGKDYTNPYIADPPELEKPFEDYLDRGRQPRMPWHDIGCVVVGEAARDLARHFIQVRF